MYDFIIVTKQRFDTMPMHDPGNLISPDFAMNSTSAPTPYNKDKWRRCPPLPDQRTSVWLPALIDQHQVVERKAAPRDRDNPDLASGDAIVVHDFQQFTIQFEAKLVSLSTHGQLVEAIPLEFFNRCREQLREAGLGTSPKLNLPSRSQNIGVVALWDRREAVQQPGSRLAIRRESMP